ncbi:LysR family transcriptional regulator [Phytopseudomonas seleniipraecipitans]|uniref:DNA-binding transcriptional regulator, LysR family n=1 Tax=Phytopseudomonas seleniipraecipitans TaxID=640205 RepID=A0A1G7H994_9GAMM|nr:LysR family transcriptional regulator [Pseudomonas seleniipraecipitans]SDE96854.1 DNA-binding transcriptional regulator, LysR family [Pseudomonas seleniipraecipitans]
MTRRSNQTNDALLKQQPNPASQAAVLTDLYWYVQIIEAGGFSAAAEQTGVGKSSLSRRIAHLERQLKVQLLNRSARLCAMTTIGEQVYRYALDVISSLESAMRAAQESTDTPSGLLKLAVPSAMASWMLATMADFQKLHPRVQFSLTLEDGQIDLATQRLDLAFTLDAVPEMSSSIVARPLAELEMVIVGTPAVLARLGHPSTLNGIPDGALLTTGTPARPAPWKLVKGDKTISHPALIVDSSQTLLSAARAGLGLAYIARHTCSAHLAVKELLPSCQSEALRPAKLYAITPPHKGITSTARYLIDHIKASFSTALPDGVRVI